MKNFKNIFRLDYVVLSLLLGLVVVSVAIGETNNKNVKETKLIEANQNRFTVENDIYKLSTSFFQKKIDLINGNFRLNTTQNLALNDSIAKLLMEFPKISLTKNSETIFESIKWNIQHASQLEMNFVGQSEEIMLLTASYDTILFELKTLSALHKSDVEGFFIEAKKSSATLSIAVELIWAFVIILLLLVLSFLSRNDLRFANKQHYLPN